MEFNKDNLTILRRSNEQIELKVKAIGTAHSVSFNLDSDHGLLEENRTLLITPGAEPLRVEVDLGYSGLEGGKYEIEIAGSSGGIESFIVEQPRGMPNDVLTFNLEGDREPVEYPPDPPTPHSQDNYGWQDSTVIEMPQGDTAAEAPVQEPSTVGDLEDSEASLEGDRDVDFPL
jgi:hypothetical protein